MVTKGKTPTPAPVTGTGIHIPQSVSQALVAAGVVAVLLTVIYLLRNGRTGLHLRRLGICAAGSVVVSAIGVAYVDHIRHDRLVASASEMPVRSTLGYTFVVAAVILTVASFALWTTFGGHGGGALAAKPPRRRGRPAARGGRARQPAYVPARPAYAAYGRQEPFAPYAAGPGQFAPYDVEELDDFGDLDLDGGRW